MSAMDRAGRDQEKELVRSRTNLLELAREMTDCEFEERGPDDWWACCPFHAEDSPSFHVRPRDSFFKCFGCDVGGDEFRFVQELRGVDFPEALHFLAERAGITLGSITQEERSAMARRRRLTQVLETSAALFAAALKHGRNPAADYMTRRGFTAETLERFDVGFVPPNYEALLGRRDISASALRSAGFSRQFCGRVSFGIRDHNNTLVGFGARTLDPDAGPKYVNTSESQAFSKRSLLYGLNLASRRAGRSGRLVVMEGYTDVMMAHQCGVTDAVATMGTAFTEEHVGRLPSKVVNLVLVFDGDRAGTEAAERAIRRLLEKGRECRALTLPGGQDPCDWFAGHDADAFDALLATHGRSSVEFLCNWELSRLDARQPGAREQAARLVMEACRTLRDPLRRRGIAQEIAQRCGVDRGLIDRLLTTSVPPAATGPAVRVPRSGLPVKEIERSQLMVLAGLFQPLRAVDARRQVLRLAPRDAFTHPGARALLALVGGVASIGELTDDDPAFDLETWREQAAARDPALAALLVAAVLPDTRRPEHVGFDAAVAILVGDAEAREARRARAERLSDPNLAEDRASLEAIQRSIVESKHRRRRPDVSPLRATADASGAGAPPAPPSGPAATRPGVATPAWPEAPAPAGDDITNHERHTERPRPDAGAPHPEAESESW